MGTGPVISLYFYIGGFIRGMHDGEIAAFKRRNMDDERTGRWDNDRQRYCAATDCIITNAGKLGKRIPQYKVL